MTRVTVISVALLSVFFAALLSPVLSCDRCTRRGTAERLPRSVSLSAGACGYGSTALGFNGDFVAAAGDDVYRAGLACGACFQVRCKMKRLCSSSGVKVVVTDKARDNLTSLALGDAAFAAMARGGAAAALKKVEAVNTEYRRIPCDYGSRNLSIRIEAKSRYPDYLAIHFLFQGGQTDIVAVDLAQIGSSDWHTLTQDYGPLWSIAQPPLGPLQFRMVVTSGYDGKWVWADRQVLPARWKSGAVYDMGVQITDIAQEGCYPCRSAEWK